MAVIPKVFLHTFVRGIQVLAQQVKNPQRRIAMHAQEAQDVLVADKCHLRIVQKFGGDLVRCPGERTALMPSTSPGPAIRSISCLPFAEPIVSLACPSHSRDTPRAGRLSLNKLVPSG